MIVRIFVVGTLDPLIGSWFVNLLIAHFAVGARKRAAVHIRTSGDRID